MFQLKDDSETRPRWKCQGRDLHNHSRNYSRCGITRDSCSLTIPFVSLAERHGNNEHSKLTAYRNCELYSRSLARIRRSFSVIAIKREKKNKVRNLFYLCKLFVFMKHAQIERGMQNRTKRVSIKYFASLRSSST